MRSRISTFENSKFRCRNYGFAALGLGGNPTLFLLQIFGMWTPNFTNVRFHVFYYLWRTILLLLMLTFLISLIVDLCVQKNVEGMIENFVISTVMFCCMLKVGVLLIKRREIIEMMDLLKSSFCLPKNIPEHKILDKYRRRASRVGAGYLLLCLITLLMQLSTPIISEKGIEKRILPYSVWQPYSIETVVPYALTYLWLSLTSLIAMPLNTAANSLISGLMEVTCGHLELLKFRLGRLRTSVDLKNCVEHHNIIFQFAERIGEIFGIVVFMQFLLSMINICSVIFVTFKSESRAGSIVSLFFLICVMTELLLFCWNGNEVWLKSQTVTRAAIANSNWITLPPQIKKAILVVMLRSQKPAEMKAVRLLTLSLDTFMMILKSSYSAFNLLQHVSND